MPTPLPVYAHKQNADNNDVMEGVYFLIAPVPLDEAAEAAAEKDLTFLKQLNDIPKREKLSIPWAKLKRLNLGAAMDLQHDGVYPEMGEEGAVDAQPLSEEESDEEESGQEEGQEGQIEAQETGAMVSSDEAGMMMKKKKAKKTKKKAKKKTKKKARRSPRRRRRSGRRSRRSNRSSRDWRNGVKRRWCCCCPGARRGLSQLQNADVASPTQAQ